MLNIYQYAAEIQLYERFKNDLTYHILNRVSNKWYMHILKNDIYKNEYHCIKQGWLIHNFF
jgi:hypothetical protein